MDLCGKDRKYGERRVVSALAAGFELSLAKKDSLTIGTELFVALKLERVCVSIVILPRTDRNARYYRRLYAKELNKRNEKALFTKVTEGGCTKKLRKKRADASIVFRQRRKRVKEAGKNNRRAEMLKNREERRGGGCNACNAA